MSQKFENGTKVKFNTNFYPDPARNEGSGTVVEFQDCQNGGDHGCDCGAGGTYYVRIDGSPLTGAYVGIELTAA